jgi:predicted permease
MERPKELWRRLVQLVRRNQFDAELGDEVQFHIESRAAELEQQGAARDEAVAQARREFGSPLRVSEETREVWRLRWLEDLAADLRYAARALRRSPGFAAAAIVSLALGTGLNTAIFSFTMEFLFSEPSVRDASTLLEARLGGNSHLPIREFRLLQQTEPLAGLAGLREESEVNWRIGDQTMRLNVFTVSDNFFDVARVPVAVGRGNRTGETDTVVVSHWFRQRQLGDVPDVLGRSLVLDGKPYTIVGVLPPGHRTVRGFGLSPHLYKVSSRQTDSLAIFARIAPGTSKTEVLSRLTAAAAELDRVYPNPNVTWVNNVRVSEITGLDRLEGLGLGSLGAFFGLVMVLVGLVLLVACANVAGLLLARAASRGHEIAVRMAIGAGRWRVARQFLAESLLLAGLGTLAGLVLNFWSTRFIERIEIPAPIPLRLVVEPDWRLALYAAGIALLSTLVCGVMPAITASRHNVHSALKHAERQVAGRTRLRRVLVAGQIAVSVLLLSTGILFLRNLMLATSQSPGFDVQHTLWAQFRPVDENYPTEESKRAISQQTLDAMRGLPGVEAAGLLEVVPLNDNQTSGGELAVDATGQTMRVVFKANAVSSDYFRAMGIPVLAGREFSDAEITTQAPVGIMNETMARQVFGGRNAIGQTITLHDGRFTVVGVVADSKYFMLGEENVQAFYRPIPSRIRRGNINIMLRCAQPDGLVKPATAALAALDPTAAVEVKPMKQALGFALLPSQVGAALFGAIGLLGLLLAAVGLSGLMAYSVARRLKEIGLRVALGAKGSDIVRLVGGEAFRLLSIGIGIGLALAWFAAGPIAMFLVPGLRPIDPLGVAVVVIILAAVGAAATLGPARHAARVDPMSSLRWE